MKKAAAVAAGVLILGCGLFFGIRAWRIRTFAERIAPENSILFVKLTDIREAGRDWRGTQLGKAIAESPRRELYRAMGEKLFVSMESFVGSDPRPVLDQFSRNASLVVFPLPSGRRGVAAAAYVSDQGGLKKYIEQQIDPGWKRRDPRLLKQDASQEGVTYYKYSSPEFPPRMQPCYALVDHHLLVAASEEALKKVLETRNGKAGSLRGSALYRQAKRRLSFRRGLLAFVNLQTARETLEENLPSRANLVWPEVVKATGLSGIQFLTVSLRIVDENFEVHGFASVAKERTGLLKVMMERKPRKMEGAASVPETAQFFHSMTLPDFSRLNEEGGANWARIWLLVQAATGLDVRRDLLEAVGDELTVFSDVPELEESKNVPVPRTAAVLLIRNPDRFGKTLGRLASQAAARGIEISREQYNGFTISQFHFRYGSFGMDPAYSLQQSWFYLSSNTAQLKNAIDTRTNGRSLLTTRECRDATEGFPNEVNAVSCTRVAAVLQSYSVMVRKEAEENEPWIREYKLDEEMSYLAEKLSGAASYTRIEDDGIYHVSRSSLPPGALLGAPALAGILEREN